jgi:hypothetical protein
MKKIMQFIVSVKLIAAFAFSAQIMLVTVACMWFGGDSIPVGYIWQMIFLALIFGCLHIHAFSEHESNKSMSARLAILGAPMLLTLCAFAYFFRWFPVNVPANWLIFIGAYIAVFLVAVFVLRAVFRIGGVKYDVLLDAYKARRDN